jgi:hypothetical protein
MDREFKFRQAGFNKDGSFREWHHWGFIRDGVFVGVELSSSTHQQAKEHTCQYTGLTDKNGKEIYEGDIVSFQTKNGDRDFIGSVIWLAEVAGFVVSSENNYFGAMHYIHNLKVIGNIYENPELIKE